MSDQSTTSTAGGFTGWLAQCRDGRGPVAHLAADAADDDTWPTDGDYRTYADYLMELRADPSRALAALREAWTLYAGYAPDEDDEDI